MMGGANGNPVTLAVIGGGQRGDVRLRAITHSLMKFRNFRIMHLGLRSANDPRTLQMQGGGNGGTTAADTSALRGPI